MFFKQLYWCWWWWWRWCEKCL